MRVTRDTRVKVPDVVGSTPEDADTALRAVGLTSEEERSGSWIDRLLPGDIQRLRHPPGGRHACARRARP